MQEDLFYKEREFFFSVIKEQVGDNFGYNLLLKCGVQRFIMERIVLEVSDKTIQDWFSSCRDICMEYFKRNPIHFIQGQYKLREAYCERNNKTI